ncbi:MAG TPA: hypothetical protein VHE81_02595 [Lacipirellulaceae bacterium]|nr:hypothetical protein [Lacipirellulaceae bacterium]
MKKLPKDFVWLARGVVVITILAIASFAIYQLFKGLLGSHI